MSSDSHSSHLPVPASMAGGIASPPKLSSSSRTSSQSKSPASTKSPSSAVSASPGSRSVSKIPVPSSSASSGGGSLMSLTSLKRENDQLQKLVQRLEKTIVSLQNSAASSASKSSSVKNTSQSNDQIVLANRELTLLRAQNKRLREALVKQSNSNNSVSGLLSHSSSSSSLSSTVVRPSRGSISGPASEAPSLASAALAQASLLRPGMKKATMKARSVSVDFDSKLFMDGHKSPASPTESVHSNASEASNSTTVSRPATASAVSARTEKKSSITSASKLPRPASSAGSRPAAPTPRSSDRSNSIPNISLVNQAATPKSRATAVKKAVPLKPKTSLSGPAGAKKRSDPKFPSGAVEDDEFEPLPQIGVKKAFASSSEDSASQLDSEMRGMLEDQLSLLNSQLESKEAEITRLQQEIQTMKTRPECVDETHTALDKRVQEADNTVNFVREQIEKERKAYMELESELRGQIADCMEKLSLWPLEQEKWNGEAEQYQERIGEMERIIGEKEEELEDLKKDYEELKMEKGIQGLNNAAQPEPDSPTDEEELPRQKEIRREQPVAPSLEASQSPRIPSIQYPSTGANFESTGRSVSEASTAAVRNLDEEIFDLQFQLLYRDAKRERELNHLKREIESLRIEKSELEQNASKVSQLKVRDIEKWMFSVGDLAEIL